MSPANKPAKKTLRTGTGPVVLVTEHVEADGYAHPEVGRYVYGIVASEEPMLSAKSNLGGVAEEVYTIGYRDLAAVVSRSPVFIFDPTRDNALAHEHVLDTVMQSHTVIPMSFGTVFRTDGDVREFLRNTYPALQGTLKQMAGKIELGLKVIWDRDRIIEELKSEHDEIHRFHQELVRKRLQSTYFARMQLGRMIDTALSDLAVGYIGAIYEGLRSVCVASHHGKPIGDKMILNAAFLVERNREPEFESTVHCVAHSLGDRLNFKYTGPWPPYNFVNIHLKLEPGRREPQFPVSARK